MYFSLFSIILLMLIGFAILFETVRGVKRGFARASLGLATVIIAGIGAMVPAVLLSDWLAEPVSTYLYDLLQNKVPGADEYLNLLPELSAVIRTFADILMTPLMFLVFFLILRFVLRILFSALFSKHWKIQPTDPRPTGKPSCPVSPATPNYEGEDISWFRRHDRLVGGIVGGFSGFLVTLFLLSPLFGTLNVAGTLYDGMKKMGFGWNSVGLSEDVMDSTLSPFVHDVTVNAFSVAGGNLVYDAITTADLDGEAITLRREIDACMDILVDFTEMTKVFAAGGATEEQEESLRRLGEDIDKSRVMCIVVTDFIKGAAGSWRDGETFLGVPRPQFGDFVDPLMTQVLHFLKENTEPDYISMDLNTMLNVYLVILQNNLVSNPDSSDLIGQLDSSNILNDIYAELHKNVRMQGLISELTRSTMGLMAGVLQSLDMGDGRYQDLMSNLAEAVTLVNSMNTNDFAEQVEMMTEHAMHYTREYGYELPPTVAKMAVTAMMDQFADEDKVDGNAMQAYLTGLINMYGHNTPSDLPADDPAA